MGKQIMKTKTKITLMNIKDSIVNRLPEILMAALIIVVFLSFTKGTNESSALNIVSNEIENVKKEIKTTRENSKKHEAEIEKLKEELEGIRNGIKESIKEREKIHTAINSAVTIDDVNKLLKQSKSYRRRK